MRKLLLILLVFTTAYVSAKTIAGKNIPDTFNAGGTNLILNGAGIRTKFGIAKVYAGGLYLKAKSGNAAQIIAADEPMGIRLHFLRDVDKDKIQGAWSEGYKNSAGGAYNSLLPKIQEFNATFSTGAQNNFTYDIIYVPGKGTTIKINGADKATITGLDFKRATFGIWLGTVQADQNLKDGMLGK